VNGPARTTAAYDSIVIGGGHNGLVCASYLARAGHRVLVLEATDRVGGAAVTREFAPGFRVSAGAHLLHQMPARVIDELALESHGLRWAALNLATVALAGPAPVVMQPDGTIEGAGIGGDREACPRLMQRLRRFAAALRPALEMVPPELGPNSWPDRMNLLKLGWRLRRLGRRDMRELLRIGGMNVYDLLTDYLSAPVVQGAIALDAVLGTNLGPRAPGTVMTLLYRMAALDGAGTRGIALPLGGLGAVSDALASAARKAGAEIRLSAPVQQVLVSDDRACGVRLQSGETISARHVVSNADPKNTLLGLVGAEHLDAGFVRRVSHLRTNGLAAKFHLALDGLPAFTDLAAAAHGARLLVAPSPDYIERAYNHSKYGEPSQAPALELSLPSVNDPTLAPPGKHVLSAVVQYAPYAIHGDWPQHRAAFTETLLDTIERYAPGLRSLVTASELLTPQDLEREFRITGGHWHHVDLALDQFFAVRPVPGATRHVTPLAGLYLCGAGCHPGGGVMGTAGRNAARQVLAGGTRA
jgi:phytoene dehydrogenase-like protein